MEYYPYLHLMHDPKRPRWWFILAVILFTIIAVVIYQKVWAEEVDLSIIATIESGNNHLAYNKGSGACGMYQFTPIAWLDVQRNFPELAKYPFSYAYEPRVAKLFAKAYFILIDRYLAHFGLKTSLSNRLACYNQGIGLTRKGILSKESKNYIAKYARLEAL